MLILSRDKDQGITVTDKEGNVILHITVTDFARGSRSVRLGFEADKDYRIDRDEVWELRKQQQGEITKLRSDL
jgi:sRNA-binding carbon storage regulator CsrA